MQYSEWTPIKNQIVCGIFDWLLRASKSVMDRYPGYGEYRYIDMNAADGTGSPSLFFNAAAKIGVPFDALLIERSKKEFACLDARYGSYPSIQTYHGDHNAVLAPYCQAIRKKPYGLIYND